MYSYTSVDNCSIVMYKIICCVVPFVISGVLIPVRLTGTRSCDPSLGRVRGTATLSGHHRIHCKKSNSLVICWMYSYTKSYKFICCMVPFVITIFFTSTTNRNQVLRPLTLPSEGYCDPLESPQNTIFTIKCIALPDELNWDCPIRRIELRSVTCVRIAVSILIPFDINLFAVWFLLS